MAMAKGESTMIETVLRIASQHLEEMVGWAFTDIMIQLVSLRVKSSKVQRLCRPIYEQVQPGLMGLVAEGETSQQIKSLRLWLSI